MEKRRTHDSLSRLQELAKAEETRVVTMTAAETAGLLGLDPDAIWECVGALTNQDFYKSMTMHGNNKVWQDVYLPTFRGHALYVKMQLSSLGEAVVISFKAKEDSI